MQPDPTILLKQLDITAPLIGFYDTPDPLKFEPLIVPAKGTCVFDFTKRILGGETLHLSADHYGCPGAGNSLCGVEAFPREALVKFLVEQEGLKASAELMEKWVDARNPYQPIHGNMMIGPLKPDRWDYLRSVTFVVNPDQLSGLMTGAQYLTGPDDPAPVICPFGSGCSLLVLFEDLDAPQSLLGATDMAMREHIKPSDNLFTVTKPMFENLCKLDEKSFLFKKFWSGLRESRGLPALQ